MQPARFRQADISLVKINNAKSMSPAVSSGRSAGSFPEQRLVIEPNCRCVWRRSLAQQSIRPVTRTELFSAVKLMFFSLPEVSLKAFLLLTLTSRVSLCQFHPPMK